MRFLKIVLALYLIVVAGFFVVSSVLSIGEPLPPITAIQALVVILLMVPLFILGFVIIRYDGGSKNKEGEKKLESVATKAENALKRLEEELNIRSKD